MVNNPDEIFGPLNRRLFEIKIGAGGVTAVPGIALGNIAESIFTIPADIALMKIDLALQLISQINALTDTAFLEVFKARWYTDNEDIDYPNIPEEALEFKPRDKASAEKLFIENLRKEISAYCHALEMYRDELLRQKEAIGDLQQEKIILNLSVDEIGALFKTLMEAKILTGPGPQPLSRILARTFSSKKVPNLSSDSLKNRINAPDEKALASLEIHLRIIMAALSSLQKK